MLPAGSTEIMMFSGLVSRTSTRSLGKETGIEVVTTGMVIRKMISNTSITSTRGVVLISEMTSSSDVSPTAMDMAVLLGRAGGRLRGLAGGAHDHGVQFVGELTHLVHHRLVAARQPVVGEHRGDGDRKADGRHDQRFTHRAGHLV